MKKVFVLISIVLCMSLLGCSKKEESEPFDISVLKRDTINEIGVEPNITTNIPTKDIDYYKENCMDKFVLDMDNLVYNIVCEDNSKDIYFYMDKEKKSICVYDAIKDTFFAGYNTGYVYIGSQKGLKKFCLTNFGMDEDFIEQAIEQLEVGIAENNTFYVGDILGVIPWEENPEYMLIKTTAKDSETDPKENEWFTAYWLLDTNTDEFEEMSVSYQSGTGIEQSNYFRTDTKLLEYDLTISEEELQSLVTEEATGITGMKEFLENVDIVKEMMTF